MLLAVEITMRHVWTVLLWLGLSAAACAVFFFAVWLGMFLILKDFLNLWRR
ncbi:hypothetical protein VT03_21185 [Planctomyces sp. SH-PL14]|nr:hypothetical protein VT03_10185 [Planctomyces sp. SH-PL14]AMV20426.1 hypothetical protein VT03_21185 [Planctomyces sp. SH-PL14]